MARYELRFRASVAKDLRDVPKADVRRILARVQTQRDDPRPPGSEKLSALERYRLRQGNYRILYTVTDADVVVEIIKIGHRREVYREPGPTAGIHRTNRIDRIRTQCRFFRCCKSRSS